MVARIMLKRSTSEICKLSKRPLFLPNHSGFYLTRNPNSGRSGSFVCLQFHRIAEKLQQYCLSANVNVIENIIVANTF